MKTLDHYKALKYPIELLETDEGVVVSHPDLPGCHSFGDTVPDALKNLEEVRDLWLEGHFKTYGAAPEPRDEDDYSGKFILRVPKWLHRQLEKTAKREGVSLNQLVVSLLSKGVTDKCSEAVSLQLCRAMEQMRGQLETLCGAPEFFFGNALTGETAQYSAKGFTKNSNIFEIDSSPCTVAPISALREDEVARAFTGSKFPNKFRSKITLTGRTS